jgi:hypothetical protein
MDLGDRVVLPPVGAKPVRARLEIRLENRFEHCLQACLNHPVRDRGNTEPPELSGGLLRYPHPPHFHRGELTGFQRVPYVAQENIDSDPGFDHRHGGAVDPRRPRSRVRAHPFPRVHQKRRVVDEVVQVTKPAIGFFDRPTVQFGLHPPYREVRRIGVRPYRRGADIHRRVFGHCFLSLTDTLPPFPVYVALPRSEYYDGSAPPTPSAGIAPIPCHPLAENGSGEHTRAVPTFTGIRSTD